MARYKRVLQIAGAALLLAVPGLAQAADFSGSYFGLIGEPGTTPIGSAQLVLSRGGHGSVSVRLEHETPAVALVSVDQNGTVSATRANDPRLQIYLSVVSGSGSSNNVVGTISLGGTAYPVTLVESAAAPAGSAGVYTIAIDTSPAVPGGSASLAGIVSATVTAQGKVQLLGSLADGTPIFEGAAVNANGEVEWFVSGGRSGSVGSFVMSFPATASEAVSGSGTLEDASGVHTVGITGSHFSRAAAFGASPAWTLKTYGTLDQNGGVSVDGLVSPAHHPAELRAAGAVPVSLTLDLRTGLLAGSYIIVADGRFVHHVLAGAVFQDSDTAEGFVLQKPAAGRFQLTPFTGTSTTGVSVNTGASTYSGGSLTLISTLPTGPTLGRITQSGPPWEAGMGSLSVATSAGTVQGVNLPPSPFLNLNFGTGTPPYNSNATITASNVNLSSGATLSLNGSPGGTFLGNGVGGSSTYAVIPNSTGTNAGLGTLVIGSNVTNLNITVSAGAVATARNPTTIYFPTGTFNPANGTFTVKSGTEILASGTIKLTSGTATGGTFTFTGGTNNVSSGTFDLNTGTFSLTNGTNNAASGAFNLPIGTFDFTNGRFNFKTGTFDFPNGSLNLPNGTFTLGTLNFPNGTNGLAIGTNSAINLTGGTLNLAVGPINLAGGTLNLTNAMATIASGTATVANPMSGVMNFTGGAIDLTNGGLNLTSGMNSFISPNLNLATPTLISAGTGSLVGSTYVPRTLTLASVQTVHLGSFFFNSFSNPGYVPAVITAPDGATIDFDVPVPDGWSVTVNGQPQTGSSIVIPGVNGPGSNGTMTFVRTP